MSSLKYPIAFIITALSATVIFELRSPHVSPEPAIRLAPPKMTSPAPIESSTVADLSTLRDTLLARPLFSYTRHPPDVTSPISDDEHAASLPRMTAIVIDGSRRSAIFAPPSSKSINVAEGDLIGPFTIQTIEPQQVVVLGPEGRRVVRTSFDLSVPPPVTPSGYGAP